jgi:hypothetical protein
VTKAAAKAVIAFVYNWDAPFVSQLIHLQPHVHLVALSPHLAEDAKKKLDGVPVRFLLPLRGIHLEADQVGAWGHGLWRAAGALQGMRRAFACSRPAAPALLWPGAGWAALPPPLAPRSLPQVCSLDDYENDRPCLHGFSAQGLSDPSRRNYEKLWGDMRMLSDYFHPSPTSIKVRRRGCSPCALLAGWRCLETQQQRAAAGLRVAGARRRLGSATPCRLLPGRAGPGVRLLAADPCPALRALQVHVMGKAETHDLDVPDDIQSIVQVSANQSFTDYYSHIYHTNALLLYFSSKAYITDRCDASLPASHCLPLCTAPPAPPPAPSSLTHQRFEAPLHRHTTPAGSALPPSRHWPLLQAAVPRDPHPHPPASCPCRFSSAVIASLITSTPIIANHDFLEAYSFMDTDHVFIQGTAEAELDVMKRVLQVGLAGSSSLLAPPCPLPSGASPGRGWMCWPVAPHHHLACPPAVHPPPADEEARQHLRAARAAQHGVLRVRGDRAVVRLHGYGALKRFFFIYSLQ